MGISLTYKEGEALTVKPDASSLWLASYKLPAVQSGFEYTDVGVCPFFPWSGPKESLGI